MGNEDENITKLELVMAKAYGDTFIKENYYTAPLKIGTPHAEGSLKKVVIMMASAGVLKGDRFDYQIICEDFTKTELTEQSYTKIFDTQDGMAERRVSITVGEEAVLDYNPCPVIPFGGSAYKGSTEIFLRKTSVLFYSEIMAVGRIAMGERLKFRLYENKISVFVDGNPVYLEFNQYEPKKQSLNSMFFLDGYTHQGSFYCYTPQKIENGRLQEDISDVIENYKRENYIAQDEILYGISEAKEGFVLKVLGNGAQDIDEIFLAVRNRMK